MGVYDEVSGAEEEVREEIAEEVCRGFVSWEGGQGACRSFEVSLFWDACAA